jgi:hypothetical protein
MTYVDHPVGHLAHTEPGRLTQLFFLVLAGVWVVRMAVEPILEIVCHRFWQFPSLPFRPLGHGGSGGGKRGDGIQGSRMLGAIGERVGLRILRESPGIEVLLGFRCWMAVSLWVGVWTSKMGRGSGPGVGRGQITVGGLRTSLRGRGREGS